MQTFSILYWQSKQFRLSTQLYCVDFFWEWRWRVRGKRSLSLKFDSMGLTIVGNCNALPVRVQSGCLGNFSNCHLSAKSFNFKQFPIHLKHLLQPFVLIPFCIHLVLLTLHLFYFPLQAQVIFLPPLAHLNHSFILLMPLLNLLT